MHIHARRYDDGRPVHIDIDGDRITAVRSVEPVLARRAGGWPLVAPGLFDLQINGHGGTWFGQEGITVDEVVATLEPHFEYGLTRLCPTLVTNSHEALAAGFAAIREACEREAWVDRLVAGCHLEGPWISAEDGPRGAHPREHVRPADWDEFRRFQDASGGRIRLVTLAPEQEGALDFIGRAIREGVVVAIGHTAASPEQIAASVDAGARLSTHLGNGAHAQIRRHPNYIWEQLANDRLSASLITDGHHLPASVVRCLMAVKGPERTIITCDAAGLAGCPPGPYTEGAIPVEILDDGRIVVAEHPEYLAGSSLSTDVCVANAIAMAGLSLAEAIDMAGRNPARLLGCEEIALRAGSRADLILFDWNGPGDRLHLRATIAAGEVRAGNPDAGQGLRGEGDDRDA